MSEELKLARQWVAKAANDLLSAQNNLKAEEVPFDAVCFHCQQASEKLLKAYLVADGHPAPRTHDLLFLLEEVLERFHFRCGVFGAMPTPVFPRKPLHGHTLICQACPDLARPTVEPL